MSHADITFDLSFDNQGRSMSESDHVGWSRSKLRDVVHLMRNGTTADQTDEPSPYPVTRIETISDGAINRSRVKYLQNPDGTFELLPGDILYSHINSISHIGKTAIFEGGSPLYHGMNLMLLRPSMDVINPRYLLAFLNLDYARNFARRECKSAINQASLSQSQIGMLPILLPSLDEQEKILTILDTLDATIQQTEALIVKLKLVKAGLLHDLLTRGLDENGEMRDPEAHPEQFKMTNLGLVPLSWETSVLGALVDSDRPIVYGILMPGYGHPGGVPVIKVKDIVGGMVKTDDLLLTSPAIDQEYRRSRLNAGDLLFTIRGTVGRTAFVPDMLQGANITQDTARIAIICANPGFIARYLGMPAPQFFIELNTIGLAVKGINLRDLRQVPIALPPRTEQDAIEEILSSMDDRLRSELAQREKLSLLKRGLMDDLLTGRVRTTVAEEKTP